jgi:hypothetical protein
MRLYAIFEVAWRLCKRKEARVKRKEARTAGKAARKAQLCKRKEAPTAQRSTYSCLAASLLAASQ